VLRNGQYGEFVSCSGYPKCKYIKQNLVEGIKCPKCGDGDIAERKARRGNLFYGCTNYPKCDFTSNARPVPEKCPELRLARTCWRRRALLGHTWYVPITASPRPRTRRPKNGPRKALRKSR